MLMRALVVAALLPASGLSAWVATPAMSQSEQAAISVAELMQATALDEIFTQFGAGMAASSGELGVPFDAALTSVWVEAAREVFDARMMHSALARSLEGKFASEDLAALAGFFRSDFGRRLTALERRVQQLSPEGQIAARAEGQALIDAMEPGSVRARRYEEMLTLVSADISAAMIGQSVRGMLIGMSVASQRGDIEVPWEEIDLHLTQIMPDLEAEVAATQRAILAYAYRGLSEADLDRYVEFLRTDAAQRFYALASYSVGTIITDTMTRFGQTLAAKMGRVNV